MTAAKRQSGLGRGLDALLGDQPVQRLSGRREDDPAPNVAKRALPVEFLRPNPNQPRRTFNEAAIEELAHSIRARGLLQPILVRPLGGDAYEIVAGERRWRAAQKAQLHDVPVIIRELTDEEAAEIALVENVQRVDLNAIEEAVAYERLHTHYHRTPDEIAKAVGKTRSYIANSLRLLTLPFEIYEAVETGSISAGHARAIAAAPEPVKLLGVVLARNLTVRGAEALAREAQAVADAAKDGARGAAQTKTAKAVSPGRKNAPESSASGPKDADTRALESEVSAALGMFVTIQHRSKGDGMVAVAYSNLEQLDEICRRLMGSRV